MVQNGIKFTLKELFQYDKINDGESTELKNGTEN